MECPHCHQMLPSLICPACGGETPQDSAYCSRCGNRIEKGQGQGKEEIDLSERTLCSDGNCIGVINEQGVCNICGKPYSGQPA